MNAEFAVQVGRELLMTSMMLALPTIVTSLVVGVAISFLQAITSIQEQTLSFAPRILAVSVVLALTLPWMLSVLTTFAHRMLWHLAERL